MTRPRNDVSGASAANSTQNVTSTSKKKLISGSDATRFHRRVFTDCSDELTKNLELSRDRSEFFKKPTPALKIDKEISWLLNHNDAGAPRILKSTVAKKLINCPYASVRSDIEFAIAMAEDALELVINEEEKYKKAKDFLKHLSDMEKSWQEISKTNIYDLTPYRPKYGSDLGWDLGKVFDSFDTLELAMVSISEIKSQAASLVNERKDKYEGGGNPGQVWQKTFAWYITLCWCSLTKETLDENKHIKHLEKFINAAFRKYL